MRNILVLVQKIIFKIKHKKTLAEKLSCLRRKQSYLLDSYNLTIPGFLLMICFSIVFILAISVVGKFSWEWVLKLVILTGFITLVFYLDALSDKIYLEHLNKKIKKLEAELGP